MDTAVPTVDTATDIVDGVLRHVVDADPVAAVSLGDDSGAGRLADLSADGLARRHAAEDALAARAAAVAPPEDPDDACDLACARAYLAGHAALRPWQPWARQPGLYLTPPLMGLHLARRAGDDTGARAALGILLALPDTMSAAAANLDPAAVDRAVAGRAAAQARQGATLIDGLPAALHGAPVGLTAAADRAGAAMRAFADLLDGLATTARGDYRLGGQTFSALLAARDGIRAPLTELVTEAERELRACHDELVGLHGTGWRDTLAALADDTPRDQPDMLARYTAETARARRFCADSGLFTMDGDEACDVTPAPPYRRAALAVASYQPPPILRATGGTLTGVFNVPYAQEGADEQAVRARLRGNSRYQLATRTVHETYPGHHWNFSRMRLRGRHAVRILTRSSAFMEGWATYTEQAMDRAGYFTPAERLGYLEARTFRAVRVMVDIGLHTGDLTPADAHAMLTSLGNQTDEVARQEIVRYQAAPTNASSYLLGAFAVEAGRRRFGDDRRYHDLVSTLGAPPLDAAVAYAAARTAGTVRILGS